MRVFLTNLLKNKQKMPRFSQNFLIFTELKPLKIQQTIVKMLLTI